MTAHEAINAFDITPARERCRRFRLRILELSQGVSAVHIAPAFSCMELVDCIYFHLMRRNADCAFRDTFLMSKGHGSAAQYVALEELGILSRADLDGLSDHEHANFVELFKCAFVIEVCVETGDALKLVEPAGSDVEAAPGNHWYPDIVASE